MPIFVTRSKKQFSDFMYPIHLLHSVSYVPFLIELMTMYLSSLHSVKLADVLCSTIKIFLLTKKGQAQ